MSIDTPKQVITPAHSTVYYSGHYWNDYHEVAREINRRISGDPSVSWQRYFLQSQGGRRFKKALILNCGNGWVERELYQLDLIEEAVGVDIAEDLLENARMMAQGQPLRYYPMDINTARFPEAGFDLVVNHAAVHHMAYLDRILRSVNRVMTPDGILVNYDYVGPHRNQYPVEQWNAAFDVNMRLPWFIQQDMRYPHLPTMLATDPTEAIHSELILAVMSRYFDISDYHPTGGAIAYLLLTHNENARRVPPKEASGLIEQIMREDRDHLEAHPDSTLFAYWVAKARPLPPDDSPQLQTYAAEEDAREATARANDGYYYPLSMLQWLYMQLEDARGQVTDQSIRITALEAHLHQLHQPAPSEDRGREQRP